MAASHRYRSPRRRHRAPHLSHSLHMSIRAQWGAFRAAGLVAMASDVTWMILSPLYEQGVAAFTTPFLSFLGVVFFTFYLRKSVWAYRYSPHYAIGGGTVME